MLLVLKNKTVVITGGAKGIGKACVSKMVEKEANVFFCDIDEYMGKETQRCIKKENCTFIKADITKEQEVNRFCDSIMKKSNSIDVLINNAAIQTENSFLNMTVEEFKKVVDVNLNGTFICSNIFANKMRERSKNNKYAFCPL